MHWIDCIAMKKKSKTIRSSKIVRMNPNKRHCSNHIGNISILVSLSLFCFQFRCKLPPILNDRSTKCQYWESSAHIERYKLQKWIRRMSRAGNMQKRYKRYSVNSSDSNDVDHSHKTKCTNWVARVTASMPHLCHTIIFNQGYETVNLTWT